MRINIRFIIKTLGSILLLETAFLSIAAGVSLYFREPDMKPLFLSSCMTFTAGALFFLVGSKADKYNTGRKEGMLTVSLTWIVLSFFGMMPFYLGGYIIDFTDAFLETMSGFTTTGMSVIDDVELLPHGIWIWRSLMQWQGGIGMVLFTVALLPMFGGGALQLFDAEMTGFTHDRFLPRVTQVAKRLSGVYLLLTLLFAMLLWAGPMDFFDAVNHAMAGISTGGCSTKNANIAYWNATYIEYVMIGCMCIGGMKLPLFYFALKGKFKPFRQDEETRWYLLYMLIFIVISLTWLFCHHYEADSSVENMIRKVVFHVVSLSTTTGIITADFLSWGHFYLVLALYLMLICGCGSSTSGGIKVGRAMVALKNVYNEFRKQTHPAAVLPVRVNGRAISQDIIYRVHIFIIVYLLLIGLSWIILIISGMTFSGALYASISAISNVGISPSLVGDSAIQNLPVASKWYLSFIMMTGRLEIFTVLAILLPTFWKR